MISYRIYMIGFACCVWTQPSPAQTTAAGNKPSPSITFHAIPKGPSVWGVFQGRFPCRGLVEQLHLTTDADCQKLKWSLTLYRDPRTRQPLRYELSIVGSGDIVRQQGSPYRQQLCEGEWSMVKGMPSNPSAELYRLAVGHPAVYLYLLKGDDNVLFILDENKAFRIGDADLSYTLNRVELVPAKNR